MTSILYLYGFVTAEMPAPPAELPGVDDRPVRIASLGRFAAAVSDVDRNTYAAGAIEARLRDLAWVGARGLEHERVVTWLADHGSVLPMRLFTLFSTPEALRAEAAGREDEIVDTLERFRDAREWDLKVSYERARLSAHLASLSPEVASLAAEMEGAGPGRRYLLERKQEDVVRREVPAHARSLAMELLDALRPAAEQVLELELPTQRDGLPVVLDAALLVRSGRADEVRQLVHERLARLEELGVHAQLTGPWAPYRFVGARAHG
ncbi:MAG TPA: GvpL/GvpF family gas vesicle protein [Longimicrobiales bacterium]|nr:GvpL/GvpF family gas vesicle protein [Longimicrobiales bacterium]